MKTSMIVSFQILESKQPLSSDDINNLAIGGFSFEIGDDLIPFDWDASSGYEENSVFHFETGRGPFFNDYEISDYFDEDYKEIGIKRENISAEFLASVRNIEDFFVNFDNKEGKEQGIGWCATNNNKSQYKINILKMSFLDLDTQKVYPVSKQVLNRYNRGEYA